MSSTQRPPPLPPSFEALFNAVPCFLTVQDRAGRILAANLVFSSTFGESRGRFCYEAYKQRSEKCENCPVEGTFRDGRPRSGEEVVILPDGRHVPIMVYTSPVHGEDGEVEAVVEISADLTPVKNLESQLVESRERFKLLFEEVPCYISVQDRDLRIVQANRSFREDFGDRPGAFCFEVYKHREEPCLNCPVARTFEDGEVHTSEEVVTSLEGRKINTLVSTAPIRSAEGRIEAVMEMSANITQIRQLQDRLTNLGLLVGSLAHGIKGLLTGLDGGMYLMNTGLEKKLPDRVDKGWGMVRRNVERIRSVVLDLLYVAKEREPDWTVVYPAGIAREAARLFEKRATDLDINLEITLDQEVGPCRVEEKPLRASLVNLLENAVDACRVDTRQQGHTIRFTLSGEGCWALFTVEDDGVGMDRETKEKLFSLFFSSKGTEGTGLGLFVANKVVEKHQGTLEVESNPGKGSRFLVRIPLCGRGEGQPTADRTALPPEPRGR